MVRNGHRVVQIEMKSEKSVPNFIRVLEQRVICDYPGVLLVCSRCKKAGHYRKDCTEDFCGWCSMYGHTTGSCTARCRRCRGDHTTADCVKPRGFAKVLVGRERPERSVTMEEDGEKDGNTPLSSAASAGEPVAPSQNEANQDEPQSKKSRPPHVTATDALQATTTGTE
ncbi:hypothetical protein HPB48_018886 [Haemaphysalis longicornis]|uniref:CCHC-type domain-containing protein n=1 Tax=Haemaphysalis longicornis TaxID=44386 RepID=A0A9J6G2Z5_HAELO|nr:hypothetical protein HPB48_018886 [Haemaphysalis longicornis]